MADSSENEFSSPSGHQLAVAPQLGWRLGALPVPCWNYGWLVLCRSCPRRHSCWQFMSAMPFLNSPLNPLSNLFIFGKVLSILGCTIRCWTQLVIFFSWCVKLLLVPETQYKWRNNFVSQCDVFVYCAKGEDDRVEQLVWGTWGRGWRRGRGLIVSNIFL